MPNEQTTMIADINQVNFSELVVQASEKYPVALLFWQKSDPASLEALQIWQNLAHKYPGKFILGKLDIGQEKTLADKFKIKQTPFLKLVIKGTAAGEMLAPFTQKASETLITSRFEENPSDSLRQQAKQLAQQGKIEDAINCLFEANQLNPDNMPVHFDIIDCYLRQGKTGMALEHFNGLPISAQKSANGKYFQAIFYFSDLANQGPDINEVQQTLQTSDLKTPEGLSALYQFASLLILNGKAEAALQSLLKILHVTSQNEDLVQFKTQAQQSMIQALNLMTLQAPELAKNYRRKMQSLLN